MKFNTMFKLSMLLLVLGLFVTGHAAAAVMLAPVAATDLEQIAEGMKSASASFESARKEVKEGYDELTRKMNEQSGVSKEVKEAIDKVLTDFNSKFSGLKGEFDALEQKTVEARDKEPEQAKTRGRQFVESARSSSRASRNMVRASLVPADRKSSRSIRLLPVASSCVRTVTLKSSTCCASVAWCAICCVPSTSTRRASITCVRPRAPTPPRRLRKLQPSRTATTRGTRRLR